MNVFEKNIKFFLEKESFFSSQWGYSGYVMKFLIILRFIKLRKIIEEPEKNSPLFENLSDIT